MSKIEWQIQHIADRLTEAELKAFDDVSIVSDDDFIQQNSLYFLGYYSTKGIETALKRYNYFNQFYDRGYENISVKTDIADPFRHRLMIVSTQEDASELLLVEMVVRLKKLTLENDWFAAHTAKFLFIEWLTLRDPNGKFTSERPQLPGQDVPGLRMGKITMLMCKMICRRLNLAGMINVPEYFHNAQMYAHYFRYLNPLYEGKRKAITNQLLKSRKLSEVSHAINDKRVLENDVVFKWFTKMQIYPLSKTVKLYFENKKYFEAVKENQNSNMYSIIE